MQKTELTADLIKQIIQDKRPTSLTQIYHTLGGSGSVSGSFSKQLKKLVPNIAELLTANKPAPSGKDSPASSPQPANDAPAADPKLTAEVKITAEKPAKNLAVKKPKAEKSVSKKPAGKGMYPIPDCVPFRPSSDYAKAWAILFAHREKGISRADFIERYRAWVGKPLKNCEFDCHVVASPRQDGSSHRSASRASGLYYCVKENDWIKLVLLSEKK